MNIALVAHDNKKTALMEWVGWNYNFLIKHDLFATGTTGRLIKELLTSKGEEEGITFNITSLKSGWLGGDLQIGSMLVENHIDLLIFFWDGLDTHPHQTDVSALLRVANIYNIATACNRVTADLIISSPLWLDETYKRIEPDYSEIVNRKV